MYSLSSIGWRRGRGRGGAFCSGFPSPPSSPHSFLAGRGRRSLSFETVSSSSRLRPRRKQTIFPSREFSERWKTILPLRGVGERVQQTTREALVSRAPPP